ncbi:enhancer of polycomb homolog 2-like isoform X3 [Betta splendens]|uniref:Enhancer of polycomb homolog 2-like isoform X3 n=1 Tax=Betta splendens TaxID=158456 RepID=A0A9W2XGY5_BETSP|nr:enhancer of polycomb homolog 2-like isoform X3 [Betta splendens]
MDSEDETLLNKLYRKGEMEIKPLQFKTMVNRLEKASTNVNRKNDEMSYEKMLKLRREFSRTVTILEMIKRREKSKRELLHLTLEVVERRYQMGDFSGDVIRQVSLPLMGKPGNCVPQMEVISEGNVSDLLPQCLCHSLGKLSLPPYWIGLSRRRMERGAVLSMQVPSGFHTPISLSRARLLSQGSWSSSFPQSISNQRSQVGSVYLHNSHIALATASPTSALKIVAGAASFDRVHNISTIG